MLWRICLLISTETINGSQNNSLAIPFRCGMRKISQIFEVKWKFTSFFYVDPLIRKNLPFKHPHARLMTISLIPWKQTLCFGSKWINFWFCWQRIISDDMGFYGRNVLANWNVFWLSRIFALNLGSFVGCGRNFYWFDVFACSSITRNRRQFFTSLFSWILWLMITRKVFLVKSIMLKIHKYDAF